MFYLFYSALCVSRERGLCHLLQFLYVKTINVEDGINCVTNIQINLDVLSVLSYSCHIDARFKTGQTLHVQIAVVCNVKKNASYRIV